MPLLTVVVPVHDEQDVLPTLYRRLVDVLGPTVDFELLFVDDGSRDGSYALLEDLHRSDPRVSVLRLSRNFGHQVAITAGLDHARGDAVAIMDADLQDPPEVLLEMLERYKDGYDVVYGVRSSRERESMFKRGTAAVFYRVIRRMTAVDIPADTGDFRLMSRKAVDALRKLPERNRFVRGLVAWVGYRQIGVLYDRAPRAGGATKYPLRKMARLATDAIVSFSTIPLQLAIALGFAISVGCFVYAAHAAYAAVWLGRTVPGWASLMVAVLLVGGVQLICLGLIGEYIGRIYDEVKQRPLYLVGERLQASALALQTTQGRREGPSASVQ